MEEITMNNKLKNKLYNAAKKARENAYVPYSHFPLGAAVVTAEGNIYSGPNIENASYGLSNCAERTAIFKAVSNQEKEIKALLLISGTNKPVSPCGACRQVIKEFSKPDFKLIMTNIQGDEVIMSIDDLLPGAFEGKDMNNDI